MTNTASEQSTFTIGQPIRDQTEHDALPLGTVVYNHLNENLHYQRVEGGYRQIRDGEPAGLVLETRYFESVTYYILSLPEAQRVVTVGSTNLTTAEADALPVGARIAHDFSDTGNYFEKDEDGTFHYVNEDGYRQPDFGYPATALSGNGYWQVIHLPDAAPAPEAPVHKQVGEDLLTWADFEALPLGTRIDHRTMDFPCVKRESGWRQANTDMLMTEERFMFGEGNNFVVSLPEETVQPLNPAPWRTFQVGDRVRAATPSFSGTDHGFVQSSVFGQEGDIESGPDEAGDFMVRFASTSQFIHSDYLTLVEAPRFTVGQELHDREEFAALPVGAVHEYRFSDHRTVQYTKIGDNQWRTSEGEVRGGTFAPQGNRIVSLPDAAPAAPAFTVGQRITDRAMVDALPLGTKVNLWDSGRRMTRNSFVKRESDFGFTETDGRVTGNYPFSDFGHDEWYIQELPDGAGSTVELPAPLFTVGQQCEGTEEWLNALPIGTRLTGGTTRLLYKHGQNDFRFEGDSHRYQNYGVGRSWSIHSLPEADQIPVEGQVTFDQHVWRCRTTIRSALMANGYDTEKADEAFEKLGASERPACEGMKIQGWDPYLATLSVGTVVADSSDVQWVKQQYQWRNLQRPRVAVDNFNWREDVTVVVTPEDHDSDWLSLAGTPADVRRIEEFNAAALRIGRGLKQTERYCGVYEETMQRLGLDPYSVTDDEPDTDDEVELTEVAVEVTVTGTSSGYWDDEFTDILGNGVTVDNPTIDVSWTKSDIQVTVSDVPEGQCACDMVDRSMVEPYVEDIPNISDWSIESAECDNC